MPWQQENRPLFPRSYLSKIRWSISKVFQNDEKIVCEKDKTQTGTKSWTDQGCGTILFLFQRTISRDVSRRGSLLKASGSRFRRRRRSGTGDSTVGFQSRKSACHGWKQILQRVDSTSIRCHGCFFDWMKKSFCSLWRRMVTALLVSQSGSSRENYCVNWVAKNVWRVRVESIGVVICRKIDLWEWREAKNGVQMSFESSPGLMTEKVRFSPSSQNLTHF